MCSSCLLDRSSLLTDNLRNLRYHATQARIYRVAVVNFFFCRDLDTIIRELAGKTRTFAYFHTVHLLRKFMTHTVQVQNAIRNQNRAIINPL